MDGSGKLTVFFDDPFWVGVYERTAEGKLEAARVIFGAQPSDAQVYELLLHGGERLRFSPKVAAREDGEKTISPKRRQREAARLTKATGCATRSQQALCQLRQEQAREQKARRRRTIEDRQQAQFLAKQRKKKQKHRGR